MAGGRMSKVNDQSTPMPVDKKKQLWQQISGRNLTDEEVEAYGSCMVEFFAALFEASKELITFQRQGATNIVELQK